MSKKDAMLNLLRDGKWHANTELQEVAGYCYSARKSELRRDGWIIRPRHVKGGKWEYRLAGRNYVNQ